MSYYEVDPDILAGVDDAFNQVGRISEDELSPEIIEQYDGNADILRAIDRANHAAFITPEIEITERAADKLAKLALHNPALALKSFGSEERARQFMGDDATDALLKMIADRSK